MPCFSFKEGKPIGMIDGGEHHNKMIYITEPKKDIPNTCCSKCIPGCGINRPLCCRKCRNLLGGCNSCGGANDEFLDEYAKIFGSQLKKMITGEMDNVNIKDGKILPIPKVEDQQVDHIYIAGPTGSGKSSWASVYISQYQKIYPKRKFYLFSDVDEDKKLDKLKPLRFKLDERMYTEPIPINVFKDSIVLFDDIDTIKDEKIRAAVRNLRDEILEKGRHNNTNVLSISHNPTNNKVTKASLLESSSIVLFPGGGDDYHIQTVLKNYCGVNPKKINEIINLESRWIQCHKKYPKYILHEHGSFFPK